MTLEEIARFLKETALAQAGGFSHLQVVSTRYCGSLSVPPGMAFCQSPSWRRLAEGSKKRAPVRSAAISAFLDSS